MAIGTPLGLGTHNQVASGTNILTTSTNDCPVGSFIIVYVSFTTIADTLSSVADSAGNSYTVLENELGTAIGIGIAYCISSTFDLPVGGTITATMGGTVTSEIGASCVSGIAISSPIDVSAKTSNGLAATAAASVSTGTLSQPTEILFGLLACTASTGAITLGGSWNQLANSSSSASTPTVTIAYQIVSSTASVAWAPTWSTARNYVTDLITVKGLVLLPNGLLYDLTIPPPRKYPVENMGFIHIFDRALLSGKDKFYAGFGQAPPVPDWRVPMPPVRSRYLTDAQEQRNRVVGQETLPKFVVDLSAPPPQRRQDFHRQTQTPENRAPLLIGQETLPKFIFDLSAPPPQRRQDFHRQTQAPENRAALLIGQETLPKFNATWEVPQPVRRQAQLSDIQEAKNRILLLIGQEQLPGFIADLRVMIPPARARDYLEALGQGNLAYLTPPIPPAPTAPVIPTVVGGAYDDPRNVPSATNLLPGELPGPLIRRAEAYRMDREPETGFPQPEQPPAVPEPDYREDMGELPVLPPVEPILAKMQRLEETALIRKALEFKLKRQLDDDEVIAILLMSL